MPVLLQITGTVYIYSCIFGVGHECGRFIRNARFSQDSFIHVLGTCATA